MFKLDMRSTLNLMILVDALATIGVSLQNVGAVMMARDIEELVAKFDQWFPSTVDGTVTNLVAHGVTIHELHMMKASLRSYQIALERGLAEVPQCHPDYRDYGPTEVEHVFALIDLAEPIPTHIPANAQIH